MTTLTGATALPVPAWRKAEIHIELPKGFRPVRVELGDLHTVLVALEIVGTRARIRVANHGPERELWASIIGEVG